MKKSLLYFSLAALSLLTACSKSNDVNTTAVNQDDAVATASATAFTTYTIRKGQNYCTPNTIKIVKTSEMKFIARFDTSAIYSTVNPVNQYDINKLYGFSEGFNHQVNSARIGWRWSDGALRLFGYVYKSSVRYSQEITAIPFNTDITCSIKLSGYNYLISANGITVTLPRASNAASATGYQLYPYFGGDETAPKNISIKIKNI